MGLMKKYAKDKDTCFVTFSLPKEAVKTARRVHLVGEFNNWQQRHTPMVKLKDGSSAVGLELKTGREYQYRYLIDGKIWKNDFQADKYMPSPYGACDNSVVIV
jgi:1,4-alpha-glucan branching enzyme